MSFYRNAEWYYDPTAGEALSNIRRREKRKRQRKVNREMNADTRTKTEKGRKKPESLYNEQTTDGFLPSLQKDEKAKNVPLKERIDSLEATYGRKL